MAATWDLANIGALQQAAKQKLEVVGCIHKPYVAVGALVSWLNASGLPASAFTELGRCVGCTFSSSDACAYDTPRSLISRRFKNLNSRLTFASP